MLHDSGMTALRVEEVAVSATFESSMPLADPIAFDVDSGSCVILTGPSGCGKSTLLNGVVGLHPLLEGKVDLFGDFEVESLKLSQRQRLLRTRISFVGQDLQPFPGLTVMNYLEFNQRIAGHGFSRKGCHELLESVLLDHISESYMTEISKGQLQRVLMCGGLLRSAELLILDEPTSALDVKSRDLVLDLLDKALGEGTAALVISHDRSLLGRYQNHVSMAGE